MILPNLIIAGVPKSGTTFLFQLLRNHPEICTSLIKETRSFKRDISGKCIIDLEKYSNFFSHHKNEKIILEASPGYFYGGKEMASFIGKTLKNVKIINLKRPLLVILL